MYASRVKIISLFLTITLVLVLLPLSAGGNSFSSGSGVWRSRGTIIVNASGGGDYTQIQWAVDNASEGDTVYVEAGTYYENLIINKTISLVGAGRENTTIDSGERYSSVYVSADFVNISGFKMLNSTYMKSAEIYLKNSNYSTIKNNNCSRNIYGIQLIESNHNYIFNNICNLNTYGIFLDNSDSNSIYENSCNFNSVGIYIFSSYFDNISNNTCYNNNLGIDMYASNLNNVSNNICSQNAYGISLASSDSNSINKNTCNFNQGEGISLSWSYYNIFINNICNFNDQGGIVSFSYSYSNTISNNICNSNNNSGISISASERTIISENHCSNNKYNFDLREPEKLLEMKNNYANGEPVIYLKNVSSVETTEPASMVILIECNNVSVNNISSQNNSYGIYMFGGSENSICNNDFSNNRYGIYLDGYGGKCDNNTIVNNQCDSNEVIGISLLLSKYNNISNNICNMNMYAGISLAYSDSNMLNENICSFNNDEGNDIYSSDNNILIHNICNYNAVEGIDNYYSENNIISNNVCNSNMNYGISIPRGNDCIISENDCSNNKYNYNLGEPGNLLEIKNNFANGEPVIYLKNASHELIVEPASMVILINCDNITVASVTAQNNSHGIYVIGGSRNSFHNSNFSNNRYGIYLNGEEGISRNNSIINNICNSKSYGIYLSDVDNTKVSGNICSQNEIGIYLDGTEGFSRNNTFINNICNSNNYGIYLSNIDNTNVSSNICSENGNGIVIDGRWDRTSDDNTLLSNTCNDNNQSGISLSYSDNNRLEKNICNSNGENGIGLSDCDDNRISDTTCNLNDVIGIYLDDSLGNTIENSICSNNRKGIVLSWSNSNTMVSNTCLNNKEVDIRLITTKHNYLANNEMIGKGIYITGNDLEHWDTQTVDDSNTLNGKAIAFWMNVSGMRIPLDTKQVILVNCRAVIVENLNLSNLNVGIALVNSTNIVISRNTINSNKFQGIYLRESDNNIISNNKCNNNGMEGFYLTGSNENEISNNTFISNTYEGIYLDGDSQYNTIHHNLLLGNRPVASDYGHGNRWNTSTHGNFWANWSKPDADGDGIVDSPYLISGWAYSKDHFPLAKHPESPILIADAGPDIVINQKQTVTFNGSGSEGPSEVTYYLWSFEYKHRVIRLHGPTPNFTFHIPGIYFVTFEIADQLGLCAEDSLFVTVLDAIAPVAIAGNDLTIYQYKTVYLQGDESYDNIGITNYTWSFIYDYTDVALDGMIVEFMFNLPGYYQITLTVSDARGNLGMDMLNVSVIDQTPPNADAGSDITIEPNGTVYFEGGGSTDNVGIVSWIWIFNYNGKNITLNGSNPLFFFNISGKYTVYLYVKDGFGNEDMDWLSVIVNEIVEEQEDDDNDNGYVTPYEEENVEESSIPFYYYLAVFIGAFMVISISMLVYKRKRGESKDWIEEEREERVDTTIGSVGEIKLKEPRERNEDGNSGMRKDG